MSRYIDANALIRRVNENEFYTDKLKFALCSIVDAAPTVDAVPVVRCKDCKNWLECLIRTYNDGERYSRCGLNGVAVGESFYCADGEREDADRNNSEIPNS